MTDAVKSIGDSIGGALGVLSNGFQTIFGDGSGLTDAFISALSLVSSALSGIVGFMDKLASNETFKAIDRRRKKHDRQHLGRIHKPWK